MSHFIYADHAATTAVSDTALQAMLPHFTTAYGNPSSLYRFAQEGKTDLERARAEIAACLNARPEEIYFTSGGTEADNWALRGVAELMALKGRKGGHIITSAIEHHAVLHTAQYLEKQGYEVTYLPVDGRGLVDPAALEGAIRIVIFIAYVAGISFMKDIRRVFMYHGAEHKCINCVEHGLDLTVENVRKSSKQHKRCGTSFLLIVMIVSILFFMLIRVDSPILRLVLRLALIPVIAGVSYEFIRLAGKSDNGLVNLLSKPGLLLQKITTREPDDAMIEVGIASVEAVFDWKTYVNEINGSQSGSVSVKETDTVRQTEGGS